MSIDKAADGFLFPRHSPFGFLPLWDAWSIIPGERLGKTTDPEEDTVDDDEYANEGDSHCGQAW